MKMPGDDVTVGSVLCGLAGCVVLMALAGLWAWFWLDGFWRLIAWDTGLPLPPFPWL